MMPKTVGEIAGYEYGEIKKIRGYERCYHPLFTVITENKSKNAHQREANLLKSSEMSSNHYYYC
jgi:hypothetical protein